MVVDPAVVIGEMVRRTRRTAPGDLAPLVARSAAAAGLTEAVIYLADYGQTPADAAALSGDAGAGAAGHRGHAGRADLPDRPGAQRGRRPRAPPGVAAAQRGQ